MRIESQFSQIDEVLNEVRKLHPFKAGQFGTLADSMIEEVRRKLQSCHVQFLWDLAFSFDIKEILACLEIMVNDRAEEVAEKAAQILLFRPRDKTIQRGWFRLVRSYPHDLLESTLRELISTKSFKPLEKIRGISSRIPLWFMPSRLTQGILHDYENNGGGGNLDDYLSRNFLKPDDGLYKGVWRHLLSEGSAKCIKSEKHDRILLEFIKINNTPYLPSFCQHYLNTLKSRENWDDPILEFIERKFQAPPEKENKATIETSFWRDVSASAKREFLQWQMYRQIEEFFEGERADFWRRYLDAARVKRVKKILDADAFMIDFGDFGVVEFKNIGNAAFIYPRDVFLHYWASSEYWGKARQFKNKDETLRHKSKGWWRDGRIIHRRGWKDDTSGIINKLLGIR